jgi:hypothetical protein
MFDQTIFIENESVGILIFGSSTSDIVIINQPADLSIAIILIG